METETASDPRPFALGDCIPREYFDTGNGRMPAGFGALGDCDAAGDVSNACRFWRSAMDFRVDRASAFSYLKEFGAWDASDLNLQSDEYLAELVLWLACCDLKESGDDCWIFSH